MRHAALLAQLTKADHWITLFQRIVPSPISLEQALLDRTRFCRAALDHPRPEESALLDFIESGSASLRSLAASPVHGDFWPGNVLEYRGSHHVIDWETLTDGSPLEDLQSYYAGAVARVAEGPQATASLLWDAFYGANRPARLVDQRSMELLRRCGIDPSASRLLFAAFLVGRLSAVSFALHPAWREFATRFVRMGIPNRLGW